MACVQHMQFFDDGDAAFFGDGDMFGDSVPCLAGELELQVQSYEVVGDVPIGDATPGKSFSLTKDSGRSSLSALVAVDFGNADFMDNVSLDDLAAADHYGHTICGRQSTADSTPGGLSGRHAVEGIPWTGVGAVSSIQEPHGRSISPQERLQGAQESSDCDMSHTHGDGESSGVGPGKSVALGSSHSEASEDNTAGLIPGATTADEEHISPPNYGLSLSCLSHGGVQGMAMVTGRAQHREWPSQRDYQQQQDQQNQYNQEHGEAVHETGQQQRVPMPRAFSVDNITRTGVTGGSPSCPESCTRRAQVHRSFSYMAPDTLPIDFSLGCDNASVGPTAFGARGRCASLNETQLRRQWLQEGELLAPRLPPSVSELELLELPEDSFPVRPSSSVPGLGQSLFSQQRQQQFLGGPMPGFEARPMGSNSMQFKGTSGSNGARSSSGAAGSALALGVTVTVKRKIITTPSPLSQQPRLSKTRQTAAAASVARSAAVVKGQSPKRPKLSSMAWQNAAAPPSSAGVLAGWQAPSRQLPGAGGAGARVYMKTVRSMPANLNSFLDGVEVTVQPLGPSEGTSSLISPNSSNTSGSTSHQDITRSPFFEPQDSGGARGQAADGSSATTVPVAAVAKGSKSKSSAGALPPPGMLSGVGMDSTPAAFMAPCFMMGPDGKRMCPLPSVPKPRKRASPNGHPPKAPAPNPNGHCCTQCGTQTTPVWRAGPHGPKTLCNACGVRYMKVAKGNVTPTPRRQQH